MAVTTKLGNGEIVEKDDLVCEVLGTIDELSASLGVARANIPVSNTECLDLMLSIAGVLRYAMGTLSGATVGQVLFRDLGVRELESLIDLYKLRRRGTGFVTIGRNKESSYVHVARTVCRRAERLLVKLDKVQNVDKDLLDWFNRLSLLLFYVAESL